MNRVATIARADARRALRSRLVWGAIALLGAMFLPSAGASATPDVRPVGEYLLLVPLDLMTFSLVVVAAVGYNAVVGERTTGTDRFVLGLPATRRDLVLGKFLSRVGVAAVALAAVLAVANVLVVRGYGRPHLLSFWVMGGWMLCYVVVWSAVTVGYSAAFGSPFRTLGALVATQVVFSLNFGVWPVVVRPLFALLFTGSFATPSYETLAAAPLWLRVTERLNPLVDFWQAVRWSVEFVGPGTPTGGVLPHLFGALVFAAFGAVPLAFGIRRFERADLGGEQAGFELGDRLWRSLRLVWETLTASDSASDARPGAARVRHLAVADVRHALQNWVVVGALTVTVLLVAPELWETVDRGGTSIAADVLRRLSLEFALPVLVLGMAVGHSAVVGERATGTVRFLLGTPVTRRELVLGKLLSRVAIVAGTLLPLLLVAEGLVVARLGGLYPGAAVAWAGSVLLFAVVWTGAVTGFSAAVSSRYRSLAAAFGTYLLFGRDVGLWDPVVRPAIAFAFTGRFSARGLAHAVDSPAWFRYLDHLNPFVAIDTVRAGLFQAAGYGARHTETTVPLVLYSLAVLFAFAAVALAVGARRFDRCDLD